MASDIDFAGETKREGLGRASAAGSQGFLLDASPLCSTDGTRTPLGLSALRTLTRAGQPLRPKRRRKAVLNDPKRESLRWWEGVQAVESRLGRLRQAPGGKVGRLQAPLSAPLRIGFYAPTALGELPVREVQKALLETVALCRALGHDVREVQPPQLDGEASAQAFFTVAGAGIDQLARMLEPMLGAPLGAAQLEPFTLALPAHYRALPEGALAQAQADIARAARVMQTFLADVDVTLCPTRPPRLGTLSADHD